MSRLAARLGRLERTGGGEFVAVLRPREPDYEAQLAAAQAEAERQGANLVIVERHTRRLDDV